MTKDEILTRALDRFKHVVDVETDQREDETEDLGYQTLEKQWDETVRQARKGGTIQTEKGPVVVPERPCLSVDRLSGPIRTIVNRIKRARLGVNIHPLSPDVDEAQAEIRQGLYKSIERESDALEVRAWAAERCVWAGRGWYRIVTQYSDEPGSDPFSQVIRLERILHQDSVYMDPSAQKADCSDAQWAFITEWMTVGEFKKKYKKDAPIDDATFQDMQANVPLWVEGEGDDRRVLLAEHYYKEEEEETICMCEDGQIRTKEEAEEGKFKVREMNGEPMERKRMKTVLWWCKMSGTEIVEGPFEQNGRYIPLVPVHRELQPFDEKRRFAGVTRNARDVVKVSNASFSALVEKVAMEPKAPWVAEFGQIEQFMDIWSQANQRPVPVLPYTAKNVEGTETAVPMPMRTPADVQGMGPSMMLVQQSNEMMQTVTGVPDANTGQVNPRDPRASSGVALRELMTEGEMSSSDFLHNLTTVSMPYEARVVLDLMPIIYDQPGRVVRILDMEDEGSRVILNQPYVEVPIPGRKDKDKRQIPIKEIEGAPMAPVGPGGQLLPVPPEKIKFYDLSKGMYGVTVSVGKSYQSRLQEGTEEIARIMDANPQFVPLIASVYFKGRDFPFADVLAELFEKVRDQQFPGLAQGEDGTPSPAQMQQMIQQLQQQLQMQGEQLKGAVFQLEANTVESQSRERIAALNNETRMLIEQIKADRQAQQESQKQSFEANKQLLDQHFQRLENQLSRGHEQKLEREGMAHDVAVKGITEPKPIKPIPLGPKD